jgi:REP element-mobilizing transposase RayT
MRSGRAWGQKSFLLKNNSTAIEKIIEKHGKACGVQICDFANGGNHLHLIVRITNRPLFKKFLRVITGLIARFILRAEKAAGKLKHDQKFWDARPFTRIVDWGRGYEILKSYLTLNKLEALGFVKWEKRDHHQRKIISVKVEPFEIALES